MERAVLDQLAEYFKARLAGYPTTSSEDESLVMFAVSYLLNVCYILCIECLLYLIY